jgi:hypothetical protein
VFEKAKHSHESHEVGFSDDRLKFMVSQKNACGFSSYFYEERCKFSELNVKMLMAMLSTKHKTMEKV